MVRTSSGLTHRQTDTRTHTKTGAGNDNTRRPKLASGKNKQKLWLLKNSRYLPPFEVYRYIFASVNWVISGPGTGSSSYRTTVAWYRYATPFFIQRGHRRSLPILRKKLFLIGEEGDGGHRIKRALYIGIKRLCIACIRCQTITGSNADLFVNQLGTQVTNVSEIWMKTQNFLQYTNVSFCSGLFVCKIYARARQTGIWNVNL